jgi:hypothetical protein
MENQIEKNLNHLHDLLAEGKFIEAWKAIYMTMLNCVMYFAIVNSDGKNSQIIGKYSITKHAPDSLIS